MSNSQESQRALQELAKRELARRRLLPFIEYNYEGYDTNWHHRVIAEALEKVERGEIKRLMIFLPPRSGKSELGAIQFPAWYLGRHPDHDIITASYSGELATDFGRKVRNLVDDRLYQNVFRTKLAEDHKGSGNWSTNKGGQFLSAGVGGGITGRGANLLTIDDPVKNREDAESETIRSKTLDWFKSTAYTRLAPNGAVVLIMTRWHDADLAGALLAEAAKDPTMPQWTVLSFPAIAEVDELYRKQGEALWPSRYSLEDLQATRKTLGSYDWSGLYQQNPLDSDTQEFKKGYYQYRKLETVRGMLTRNYLTIDTALSKTSAADNTGLVMNFVDRENKWNLMARRLKITPLDLIDALFSLHAEYHFEKIGIEQTVYLDVLKPFLDQEMRVRNVFLPIVELKHKQQSKELRIRSLLPRYQSRSIYHIEGECLELEEEELRFPKGVRDDCVDAAAYQSQVADPPLRQDTQRLRPPLKSYVNRNYVTR